MRLIRYVVQKANELPTCNIVRCVVLCFVYYSGIWCKQLLSCVVCNEHNTSQLLAPHATKTEQQCTLWFVWCLVHCALLFCALCASWSRFHKSEAKVTSGALSHHIICQPRSSSPIFLLLLFLLVVVNHMCLYTYQETKMCSIFKTLPKSKPSQPPTSLLYPPLVHQTSTHPLGQIRARSAPLGRGG